MSTKKQNFIRKFKKHSDYEAFLNSEDFITPNVSGCEEELHVHYNPKQNKKATGVTLNVSTLTVPPASEHSGYHWGKIVATVLPEDAPNKEVTWRSSDETLLKIGSGLNPYIQVLADTGTCVITVTTVDGGYTAQCTVNIDKIKPNGLEEDSLSYPFPFYITDDGHPWHEVEGVEANSISAVYCLDAGGFYPSDTSLRFVRTGGTIQDGEFQQETGNVQGIDGFIDLGAIRTGTLSGYIEPASDCTGECGQCQLPITVEFIEYQP
jgi:hypothetical protein